MKPIHYRLEIWALISNLSIYIYNLMLYCGTADEVLENGLTIQVVLDLTRRLGHHGHIMVPNQFFTFPSLYEDLLQKGI